MFLVIDDGLFCLRDQIRLSEKQGLKLQNCTGKHLLGEALPYCTVAHLLKAAMGNRAHSHQEDRPSFVECADTF
jgi:hypothetical protein